MRAWTGYEAQQWKYVLEITRAIASNLDLESVLNQAVRYAVDLVGGEAGLLALRDTGDRFRFAAQYQLDPQHLTRFQPLLTEIPLTIEQDQTPRWRFPQLQFKFADVVGPDAVRLRYVMALPLIAGERLLGIIYVFRSPRDAAFTTMDQDALAGFADHVALAIEHARLYHDAAQRAQELAAVIDASAHGILIAEPGGKVRGMNRALEQLTGWLRHEARGKEYAQVLRLLDERGNMQPPPVLADVQHQGFTIDGFLKRWDGSRGAYVQAKLAPLYDERGELFSIIATVADLSALKEADELKTTFLAGISHDLKTPLALIRGYAETLRRGDVEWDRQTLDESLATIQDEAEYLTSLVNALLDAAQLQRGSLPLQWHMTCVDELATKIVEHFQALQEHRWAVEFPADFPAVPADPERIREVLQNLVANAVKYSPRGSLIIVGGWVESERIGIVVRDEGPGIPLEEQSRIFERFTRGRGQHARRAQGAGLGLYLCRAIVEQHGGKIWMENLPERGAAFYFTLPRVRNE